MQKKTFAICMLVFSIFIHGNSQSLGEFKPKSTKINGANKFNGKAIYIANFSVNFQLYNLKTASTKGGFSNNTLSGNSKASLAVGLDIPSDVLQDITNEAYRQFVADLEADGFTILHGDAASNTQFYEGGQRFENMEMSISEAPGMLTVYPQNTVFYVKGFNKDGQKKQGGVSASFNRALNDDGRNSIVDEIRTYPKLSDELDNATIVNADLYVLFLDVKKPYQGNGAKITANTNLRLAAYDHINSRVSNTSATTKLGITGSTKEKNYLCVSAVDFVQGKNKIGGSPLGTYSGLLKEDLSIEKVLGNEKIQAYAKSDKDYMGVETAFGKMYRADAISVENTASIHADATSYQTGVTAALHTFLKYHVNEFLRKHFN